MSNIDNSNMSNPSPSELFSQMTQEGGVAEYHRDNQMESIKIPKSEIKANEDALTKHEVELHLDNDRVPNNQQYMLVSFIDPEEVLDCKEVFCFGKFLDSFSTSLTNVFEQIEDQIPEIAHKLKQMRVDSYRHLFTPELLQNTYRFFKKDNYENLKQDFYKLNKFRTSERGFKIRGAYGSLEEAQKQAKKFKDSGDQFNIFIGQMGYWMPFNPPTDEIENQQYAIEELNTLMKNYKEQQIKQEQSYEERKRSLREIVQLKEQAPEKPETPQVQNKELQDIIEEVQQTTIVDTNQEV